MMSKIDEYLDYLYPNPKCELNYTKDYELLMAIVLSAQTTDKMVNTVTPVLFNKYPSLKLLKEGKLEDLESILRPIGFKKKAFYIKEIARILDEEYGGVVPRDRDVLSTFPGVGRKTTNVFLSEFYGEAAIAVDTHVERVSKRLGLANPCDNVSVIEKKLMKYFSKDTWAKRHLQLVLFGRYHCKSIKPDCENCKLLDICKKDKLK